MRAYRSIAFGLFVLMSLSVCAQNASDIQTLISTANNIKTGNYQDALTSLMLFDFKNITGPDKALEYKTSLYALKLKTDPSLSVDTNYIKHGFYRNLQLGVNVNMQQDFSFKGFGGSITYAIINKRDSTVLSLIGTEADRAHKKFSYSLALAKMEYKKRLRNSDGTTSPENKKKYDDFLATTRTMLAEGTFDVYQLPVDIRGFIDTNARNYVDSAMNAELNKLRKKPLFTVAVKGNYNTVIEAIDNASFNATYLQGITESGRPLELDIRANARYFDTVAKTPNPRLLCDFSLGGNWAMLYNKRTGITFLEVKPSIEYAAILDGLLPGEEASQFYANAEFRLRVTRDIWFPVGVKYDIQNQNFLGFLNVSYNLDALKTALTN